MRRHQASASSSGAKSKARDRDSSDRPKWRFLWLALLSLLVLQAARAFSGAAEMDHVGNHDTAYYYSVARNVAHGQVKSDIVLWHWLGIPETVARPPGEYWSPGWPFLLGSAMSIVGTDMKHAMWICASLSLALPLLVFWATYLIRPNVFIAWLAGLVLIPQELMGQTSFMPDVALPTQLFLLLGVCLLLGALGQGSPMPSRWCLAGAVLTVPFWLRGDGFLVCMAVVIVTLLSLEASVRERAARTGWLLVGSSTCFVPLFVYNLWAFGTITPQARAMSPFIKNYADFYLYETDPSFESFWSLGQAEILDRIGEILTKRAGSLLETLPLPLLILALAGCLAGRGRPWRNTRILHLVTIIVLIWFVPGVIAQTVSVNAGRFLQASTPLICILAALGFGWSISRLRSRPVMSGVASLAFLLSCSVWFWPLELRNPLARAHWKEQYSPVPEYLSSPECPTPKPDEMVLTTDPWQVSAVLGIPTVVLPMDSPDAVRKVVARYHPRYLALPNSSHFWIIARLWRPGSDPELLLRGLTLRPICEARDGVWYEIGDGPR